MRLNKARMFTVRKLYSLLKYGITGLCVFFLIGLLSGSKRNSAESDVHQELILSKEYVLEDIKLYEAMIADDEAKVVPGWGELGGAVNLRGEDLANGESSFKKNAINIYLSDRVSLNRTLADYRDPKCRKVLYDAQLPSASVIIIFHNEPYSVLLRTVWSVLNSCRRTKPWFAQNRFYDFKWNTSSKDSEFIGSPGTDPKSEYVYLKEIILVDDNSTLPELRGKLGYYIRTRFPQDMVKLIRLPNRQGLIRARLAGGRIARGDALVFLDAHCEPAPDWLRPLLQRSKHLRRTALVPIIDLLDADTLEYSTNGVDNFQVGGFDFDGQFTWIDVSPAEKKRRGSAIAPTWSPTMAGGLFAIDRKYFWEIGSYDEQMDGWGGENLEMSFRIWQCGGTLETIPCSRVGHIFRAFHPYKFPGEKDTHGINTGRLAKVWMDDYADIFFLHRPDLLDYDVGDLTHRKVLREKLKCKSFKWYLDNIYKDKFIPTKNVSGYGRLMNPYKKFCIDTMQREEEQSLLGVYPCHEKISMTQFFSITKKGEIRTETLCAQIQYKRNRKAIYEVTMDKCHGKKRDQQWKLIPRKKDLYSIMHLKTGTCLDITGYKSTNLESRKCDNSPAQSWIVEFTAASNFSNDKNPVAKAFEQSGYFSDETSAKTFDRVENRKPVYKEWKPELKYGPKANAIPGAELNLINEENKDAFNEELNGYKIRKLQAVDLTNRTKGVARPTAIPLPASQLHRRRNNHSGRNNNGKNAAQNDQKWSDRPRKKHHRSNPKGKGDVEKKPSGRRHSGRNEKKPRGDAKTTTNEESGVERPKKAGSDKKNAGPTDRGKRRTELVKGEQDRTSHGADRGLRTDGRRRDRHGRRGRDRRKQVSTPAATSVSKGVNSRPDSISVNEMVSVDSGESVPKRKTGDALTRRQRHNVAEANPKRLAHKRRQKPSSYENKTQTAVKTQSP